MSLYDQIVAVYPELTNADFDPYFGVINLCNDADGFGDFILKWEYSKPIPEGLKIGK